jgi:hypothetical protein
MSGGRYNYDQYKIGYIAEHIEKEIEKSGRPKTEEELKKETRWYDEPDPYHYKYPEEVIERFKLAVKYLKIAEVYAHRVDWLLSGDDGEDSFISRLDEDLRELNK